MGVLVVFSQIVPSCCIASHQASLIAATGQQFPYEFSYGELRCPAPSAPAVASRSSRAHKFLVKPTAPRPIASAPASASGSGPNFSPIPTTGSISAQPNRRGRSAILTIGVTTVTLGQSTNSTTENSSDCVILGGTIQVLQRWTCEACRRACTESRGIQHFQWRTAFHGSSRSHRCA